jgi:hypothetical protein
VNSSKKCAVDGGVEDFVWRLISEALSGAMIEPFEVERKLDEFRNSDGIPGTQYLIDMHCLLSERRWRIRVTAFSRRLNPFASRSKIFSPHPLKRPERIPI